MNKIYIIVGRLINQSTPLSQVRLLDYDTFTAKWVDEAQLLNIKAHGGNIVNLSTVLNAYDVPHYQIVGGKRQLIKMNVNQATIGIALGLVQDGNNCTRGLLIARSMQHIEFISFGARLEHLANVVNLGLSPEIQNTVGEWSVTYKDILPIIKSNRLTSIKGLQVKSS